MIHRRVTCRMKIAPLRLWTTYMSPWISRRFPHRWHVKIIRHLPRLVQIITNWKPKIKILRLILLVFLIFHCFTTLLHTSDARRIQWDVQSLLQELLHSLLMATSFTRIP
jgi:hypothetical protein